jgi:peptidyl-prolyl cis-trans isomerase C
MVHRGGIWKICVLAGLAAIAPTLKGQSGLPPADFVILKCEDLTPSNVHLAIIVVDTAAEAESLRKKLESGARFEALASEHSRHPTAVTGGEFGVFSVADLRPEFRAALKGVKPGGYTPVIAVPRSTVPGDWPEALPLPGAPLKSIESALGRSYSATTLPADGSSAMTEITYPFGVRLRIHDSRGLGFMEFTAPWRLPIFGIRPDDQIPASVFDTFPSTGRFIRGVFVGVPGHPHWFIDVDDRVDAVIQLLWVDRDIYGNLAGIPKGP